MTESDVKRHRPRCEFCKKTAWRRRVLPKWLSPQGKAAFPEPLYKDLPISRVKRLSRWYRDGDEEMGAPCYLACRKCQTRIMRYGDPRVVLREPSHVFKVNKKRKS